MRTSPREVGEPWSPPSAPSTGHRARTGAGSSGKFSSQGIAQEGAGDGSEELQQGSCAGLSFLLTWAGKGSSELWMRPQLGKKMNKILQNRQGIHLRGARKCQREPGSTRQCQAAPGSTRQCQAAPGGAGALIQLTTDNPTTPPLAAPRPCHGQEGEL